MNEIRVWFELGAAAVTIILFIIKINKDRDEVIKRIETDVKKAKEDGDVKLNLAKEDGDVKRIRVWERIDEVKKEHRKEMADLREEMKNTFVDIRLCKVVHDNSDRIFEEIKNELTEFRKSIDKLYDKLSKGKD